MIEFSMLISAVKPRERTDKYVILAALFVLKAYDTPSTTRQVSELLKLHLKEKGPSNVGASLSSYTHKYVSPHLVEKGQPKKWTLIPQGIEHLRSLSGLTLATNTKAEQYDYDIGIICALPNPELDAVQNAFGGPSTWSEVGDAKYAHIYKQTKLTTHSGETLRIVGTTSMSMGLTAAAIATTQLILQFRPKLVIMTGIAAGDHFKNKQYGDVLVADPSVDYTSGKFVVDGGVRNFQPDPYPIGLTARLRAVLQKYQGEHNIFKEIRSRWSGNVPTTPNRLHIGPLGAADQVVDDPNRIVEIKQNWRKLIGVEMETYGVYRAVHEAPEPKPRVVSLKSICDFADQKTDEWQQYAAFVAAEFAADFIKREWASLWHKV